MGGGNVTDDRGIKLVEFISRNNLSLLKYSSSPPTFSTKNGRSWIDLSMISNNLQSQVRNWEVLEEDTQSDHKYIKVELFSMEIPKKSNKERSGKNSSRTKARYMVENNFF